MADEAHKYTDNELKALERRLTREYSTAAKELSGKLDEYLQKFADRDSKKRAQLAEGKITAAEYKQWRYGQIMTGKRWKAMRNKITDDLVNVDKITTSMMNDELPRIYAENHNYGTYTAETGANLDTAYTLYSQDTVRALVQTDDIQLPAAMLDSMKDAKWCGKNINSAVLQGVLQGEAIDKIAKRMYNVTDMSRRASIRNARTIVTAVENQGRLDSFKRAERMGIKMEQAWLATLDGRTRHSHRLLDGERVKVGGTFSNGCRYPGDPEGKADEVKNCRCTLVGIVDGVKMDFSDLSQRNTDHLNGMSYEEWKKAKTIPKKPGESVKAYEKRVAATKTPTEIEKRFREQ